MLSVNDWLFPDKCTDKFPNDQKIHEKTIFPCPSALVSHSIFIGRGNITMKVFSANRIQEWDFYLNSGEARLLIFLFHRSFHSALLVNNHFLDSLTISRTDDVQALAGLSDTHSVQVVYLAIPLVHKSLLCHSRCLAIDDNHI